MSLFRLFSLPIHVDSRFSLVPLEVSEHVPFEVKRVYAIVDGSKPSGSHCHKQEEEVFFCVRGTVTAQIDDGFGIRDVLLTQGDAMYVPAYVWHHFETWEPGTVVVAVSSTPYNPGREDYITDHEEFKREVATYKPISNSSLRETSAPALRRRE